MDRDASDLCRLCHHPLDGGRLVIVERGRLERWCTACVEANAQDCERCGWLSMEPVCSRCEEADDPELVAEVRGDMAYEAMVQGERRGWMR